MIETSVVKMDIIHFEFIHCLAFVGIKDIHLRVWFYTRCISFCFIRRVCRALAFPRVLSKFLKGAFEMGAALNGDSHGYRTQFRRMRLAPRSRRHERSKC